MAKQNIKSALKGSLMKEENSINERFKKAELLLGNDSPGKDQTAVETVEPPQKELPVKVIRDSFTMPQSDYDLINALKMRSLKLGIQTTKSEIIRAGLQALDRMNEEDFSSKLNAIEKIKTGRPKTKE